MDLLESVRKKSAEISFVDTGPVSGDYIDETIPLNKNIVDVIDPVDALSANREQTMVVAAGCRGVLKVFKVSDDGIQQVADLRSSRSRKLNLLYSPSNVAWSKLKDDLIATTSTNGAVVLWNMTKAKIVYFGENIFIFLDTHYKWHQRSATVVHFHHTDENLVISGSKDATVYMYDLRKAEPTHKFGGTNSYDVIRDLSFFLHSGQCNQFITSDDSGTIRLWDTRRQDKYNFIKVVNDMNVHIWDIRRPFLPYASFEDHRDSVTDVWWSAAHPERFVSCGKDGLLVLHYLEQKQSPLTYACDVAVDISPDGLLGVAANSHYACIKREKDVNGVVDGKTVCKEEGYDPFRTPVRSQLSCGLPDSAMKALQPTSFFHLAQDVSTQPLKTLYLKPATLIASWDFYFGTGELRGTEIENDEENPYFNDFNCLQEEAFNLKDLSGDNYQNFPEETSDTAPLLLNTFVCEKLSRCLKSDSRSKRVPFVDFVAIFLCCDGFAKIQEVVVDDSTCRPSDFCYNLLLMKLGFGEVFWNFASLQAPVGKPSVVV
uniref:GATOR2 complex protein WDR24 n=1 Tax=Heterorhabditis bacteriophora TaxID=37862 RepID=A0A1I7W790_HETBA